MNQANIFLMGQPIGKGRPRFTRSGHVYTPDKTKRSEQREIFPGKPDIDNVAKIVLDSFNGVVFEDDAQVYELRVLKGYGDPCLSVAVAW